MGVASGGDGIDLSLEGHPDCVEMKGEGESCLLYTSDAADDPRVV